MTNPLADDIRRINEGMDPEDRERYVEDLASRIERYAEPTETTELTANFIGLEPEQEIRDRALERAIAIRLGDARHGPGWDRFSVERIVRMIATTPIGASGDGDQLRALLADRDRLYAAAQAWIDEGLRFEGERDRLEEELVEARAELDRLRNTHLLIPRAGVVGYRVRHGYTEDTTTMYAPADVEIVVRGDVGQDWEVIAGAAGD